MMNAECGISLTVIPACFLAGIHKSGMMNDECAEGGQVLNIEQ